MFHFACARDSGTCLHCSNNLCRLTLQLLNQKKEGGMDYNLSRFSLKPVKRGAI